MPAVHRLPLTNSVDLQRRRLLVAGGGLALLTSTSHMPVWAGPLGANPFTLGVASGDPTPDGFVIWTRLAPRPLDEHGGMPAAQIPVRWEVAEDEAFRTVVRQGESLAMPELAHSVHVEVDGLRPHRHYWYRFSTGGSDTSPVGRVRTSPTAGAAVDRVRVGLVGCQHYEQGFYDGYAHLAREDLDLAYHYGDYIYEGGPTPLGTLEGRSWTAVRQHVGNKLYSIDDYRRRYAQYRSDPLLQAAHASCAFAMSFDDHEIENNWAGGIDQQQTALEIFALRRLAALQAWYENMPVRRAQFPSLQKGGLTAYRRLDYGRLLRVHVLDTRSYRSDQPCDDGKRQSCGWDEHTSPDILGSAQEAWLDRGLAHDGIWNLLAQQITMMPVDSRAQDASDGKYNTDIWDGYRPARKPMIDMLQRHGRANVVVASGDLHRHVVGEIPVHDEDPAGAKVAVEFQGTSISSSGNGTGDRDTARMLSNNPHFDLYTDRRGYQLFDITPTQWTTEVKVIDQVERPGGTMRTLQRYVVAPGQAKLERA